MFVSCDIESASKGLEVKFIHLEIDKSENRHECLLCSKTSSNLAL